MHSLALHPQSGDILQLFAVKFKFVYVCAKYLLGPNQFPQSTAPDSIPFGRSMHNSICQVYYCLIYSWSLVSYMIILNGGSEGADWVYIDGESPG